MDREFDRTKDCARCRRYIDEETVKLKKIVIGGDTYRQTDPEFLAKLKYEKICTECFYNKA